MLNPQDIEKRKFQVVRLREGYSQDEVDDFIDEVVVSYKQLQVERDELRRQVEHYTDMQATMEIAQATRILKLAEQAASEEKQDAMVKAHAIINQAQTQAQAIVDDGKKERHAIIGEMEERREKLRLVLADLESTQNEVIERMQIACNALKGDAG